MGYTLRVALVTHKGCRGETLVGCTFIPESVPVEEFYVNSPSIFKTKIFIDNG